MAVDFSLIRPDDRFARAREMFLASEHLSGADNICEFSGHIAALWGYVGPKTAILSRLPQGLVTDGPPADIAAALAAHESELDGSQAAALDFPWFRDFLLQFVLSQFVTPEILDKIPVWLSSFLKR